MMYFQRRIVEMSCAGRVLARRQLCSAIGSCYVHTAPAIATSNDGANLRPSNFRWRIYTGVILERFPIAAPPLSDVERQYKDVKSQMELENSFLNNFELRQLKEKATALKRAQLEAEGKNLDQLGETIGISTAELDYNWQKKADSFAPPDLSKIEVDDEKSLKRKFDRKLVLVVRQRFGVPDYVSPWSLPYVAHRDGESLRQTVERSLASLVHPDLKATVTGNAPFVYYSRTFPTKTRAHANADGMKLFVYKAVLSPPFNFKLTSDDVVDYKWVTHDELAKYLSPRKFRNKILSLVIE
uniref:39S ribosomal protein L46, mitochondrial n=1 Tax=Plectus sambesii TaxID=2011161 RepID=A0A914XB67_9BILA